MLQDVLVNHLSELNVDGGNVLHSCKSDDAGFKKFGECYFSFIDYNYIKGWKRHNLVTLNLSVPIGMIKFVMFDTRKSSQTYGKFQEILIGKNNYKRLTIPPKLWVAFQGIEKKQSLLMNLIDFKHDPNESDNKKIDYFNYDWSLK